jgi:LAS superfamily LD-carboxypeptidase LdcB
MKRNSISIVLIIVIAICSVFLINTLESYLRAQALSGNIDEDNEHNPVEIGDKPSNIDQDNNAIKPLNPDLFFEKTTLIDVNSRKMILNYDSILVLVNKERNLPSDYTPKDLVIPNVPFPFKGDEPRKYMRVKAAEALEELFERAKDESISLVATSGYRSYSTQKSIFDRKARALGFEEANKTSAYPGQSEHQTGLAMDVTSSKVDFKLVQSFGETKEGIWLKKNSHHFGFIIRYPKGKEDITGYIYEPWHIRYVGLEMAEYLYNNNLTLEEYFQKYYGY